MKEKLNYIKSKLDYNAPVILTFTLASLIVLIISMVTKYWLAEFLSIHYTSWLSPMQYVRMFTHPFAHASVEHYVGNFMIILLIGPMVEEKYHSDRLVFMMLVTSFITAVVTLFFFKNIMLMGASGIVFMLILLASFANAREGKIPLTFILVAILYIGNEIVSGVTGNDDIAQFAHIIGGISGSFFGFVFARKTTKPAVKSV